MPSIWLFAMGCIVLGIAVAGLIASIGIEMNPAERSRD